MEGRPLPSGYNQRLMAIKSQFAQDAKHRQTELEQTTSLSHGQRYILRVRTLARGVAQAYYEAREALGFPMLPAGANPKAVA